MNIFYIHIDPKKAAEYTVDSHCVKMILESCQLLSTAHRLLDGVLYTGKTPTGRNVKRWRLDNDKDATLYSATHINHPSAVWCRGSDSAYLWLHKHLEGLLEEYTFRYGKIHKSTPVFEALTNLPKNIKKLSFEPPPPAMDQKYIISNDSLVNYRNYYKYGKKHLHKWTKRNPPDWILE